MHSNTRLRALAALLPLLAAAPLTGQRPDSTEIPARFVEGRIYVLPVTAGGDTLVFYTDTGGGVDRIYAPAAERLALPLTRVAFGEDSASLAEWPAWQAARSIPASAARGPARGRLVVLPMTREVAMLQDSSEAGFLGAGWFADRVWTFDYPAGRLFLRAPGNLPAHTAAQRVPLFFQADSLGTRTTNFPRIRVRIDGDSLDLLFDTGATMLLTDSAYALLADGRARRRAASFISATVLDRWRSAHPEWRYIERATSFGAPMIEVPEVEVAGVRVGPVWFEGRRAGIFEEWMSQWLDAPVVGALGGNALGFFRVTADYANGVAVFERR